MKQLRTRLLNGDVILGQMVLELFTPGIGPMLAASGLDFVLYDMEHGRCDIAQIAEMVASCRGSDIVPWVRVPDFTFRPLSRLLDIGARGVMVPRVDTRAQAEEIVAQLKYPPIGARGVALGVAHDLYQAGGAEFFTRANEETIVIIQLESAKAFKNIEDILSVPGIDVAWLGHYDLTVSMGIPLQFDHPRLLEAMDAMFDCCRRNHVAPAFITTTPESTEHWIQKGLRVVSLGTDIGIFQNGIQTFHESVLRSMAKNIRNPEDGTR
jgi:2-keto-3-deoxy-L-rhamnonate aldolase RhmA